MMMLGLLGSDIWRRLSVKGPVALMTCLAYTCVLLPLRVSFTSAPMIMPLSSCKPSECQASIALCTSAYQPKLRRWQDQSLSSKAHIHLSSNNRRLDDVSQCMCEVAASHLEELCCLSMVGDSGSCQCGRACQSYAQSRIIKLAIVIYNLHNKSYKCLLMDNAMQTKTCQAFASAEGQCWK